MFTAPQQFLIALIATLSFGAAVTFGLGNQDQIVPRTGEAAKGVGAASLGLLRDVRHGFLPGLGPQIWPDDVAEDLERRGILMADAKGRFVNQTKVDQAIARRAATVQVALLSRPSDEDGAGSGNEESAEIPKPMFAARGLLGNKAAFVVGYRGKDEAKAANQLVRAATDSGGTTHLRTGQVGNVAVVVVDAGNAGFYRSTMKLVQQAAGT